MNYSTVLTTATISFAVPKRIVRKQAWKHYKLRQAQHFRNTVAFSLLRSIKYQHQRLTIRLCLLYFKRFNHVNLKYISNEVQDQIIKRLSIQLN